MLALIAPKSQTALADKRAFTKFHLQALNSRLVHEDGQVRVWSASRRKLVQVLCLILSDVVVFLRLNSSSQLRELKFKFRDLRDLVDLQSVAELPALEASPAQAGAGSDEPLPAVLAPDLPDGQTHDGCCLVFANVDDKSSVLPLDKLLIREKAAAAADAEPRVYLISSAPVLPEMYELAFSSRKHRAHFVDKLRGAIATHNATTSSCGGPGGGHAQEPESVDADFGADIERDVMKTPPADLERSDDSQAEDTCSDWRSSDADDRRSSLASASPPPACAGKLRARRRRNARHRKVSLQTLSTTSSSSSSCHRKAIQLAASSLKQAAGVESADACKQLAGASPASVDEVDDEFDSGRGNDDSCASSTSGKAATSPPASHLESISEPQPAVQAPDCQKALKAPKQRKLSTVSTMSSQLKLISRLRSHCRQQPATIAATPAPQKSLDASAPFSATTTGTARRKPALAYIPEQKLEELRNLQIKLDNDKQEWQAKFEQMQEHLLNERHELDLAREQLKRDRLEVAHEREQLYRKLDVLRSNGIVLSPSLKLIATSPVGRHFAPSDKQHLILQQQQSVAQQHNASLSKLSNNFGLKAPQALKSQMPARSLIESSRKLR